MDIVYPLNNNSRWANNEIRFSLRSVNKHTNHRNIYLIGHNPGLVNVIHIPFNERHMVPDRNIMEKVSLACQLNEVSDPFLFMNDDHYFLSDFDLNTFPFFYSGSLTDRRDGVYGIRRRNTAEFLKSKNLPTLNFDTHVPILIKKKKFIESMKAPWDIKHGFVMKSLYANTLNISPIAFPDFKISKPPDKKIPFFSSTPAVHASLVSFLNEKFPNLSYFEKE